MAVSHFSPQFQISARAETSHVIATKFQPGGLAEISAWAETRHVIGPLVKNNPDFPGYILFTTEIKNISIKFLSHRGGGGNQMNIPLILRLSIPTGGSTCT